MTILIFGSNGMLGRYIKSYISKQKIAVVYPLTRKDIDIYTSFKDGTLKSGLETILCRYKPNYVFNAAGCTGKSRDNISPDEMFIVNAYFPIILADICSKYRIKLFHPSTDCVFSGKTGNYDVVSSISDCSDIYGASKAIAENINAMVIRVSIIGHDTHTGSLLEWALSQTDEVRGYINHRWNGITCLEYAKIIGNIITEKSYIPGITNYASKYGDEKWISKYDLLCEIYRIYNRKTRVVEYKTFSDCDRTLVPTFGYVKKDIVEQIIEMKNYIL